MVCESFNQSISQSDNDLEFLVHGISNLEKKYFQMHCNVKKVTFNRNRLSLKQEVKVHAQIFSCIVLNFTFRPIIYKFKFVEK